MMLTVASALMPGLAAARQLRASGHKVVILEGNGRAGGRVYTKRLEVWPSARQAADHLLPSLSKIYLLRL
jgi:monoamine oxidase